jgi:hypothetical protein
MFSAAVPPLRLFFGQLGIDATYTTMALHGSDAHGLDGIERHNWLAIDTTTELPLRIGPRSRDVLAEYWAACPSEHAGHGYLFLFIKPFIKWGR